jgi:hypothetical protein
VVVDAQLHWMGVQELDTGERKTVFPAMIKAATPQVDVASCSQLTLSLWVSFPNHYRAAQRGCSIDLQHGLMGRAPI